MTHKITIKISLLLALLFTVFLGTTLSAQTQAPYIKGTVHDEYGKPLTGVVVNSENGKNRIFTDEKGEYSIVVNDGSKHLKFAFIGYVNKTVSIENKSQLDVSLKPDVSNPDEVIQLGYSSQRRSEISGAVSTVSGEELKKSPVANLSMTFDGRLPGLITQESGSELSRATTDLYVRGLSANRANGPLVVIDGIPTSYKSSQSLEYISPAEIESVTLLKDASTEAIYGIQGANGVLVITTKKGQQGDLKVNVRVDESLQQVTTTPTFINSSEYATLRNEAANNDGKGLNYFYSDDQIANYKSGTNRSLYPNTNWYDLFMKKYAQMQRVNVDLQGGNERIQYFTDVNVMHQGSQFKVDHPAYSSNLNYSWANIRSNVNMKLNSYLSAHLNLAANIKREKMPNSGTSSDAIYSSMFDIPSTVYGPVTPTYIDASTGKAAGNQVITTNSVGSPTYGILNRDGFTRHTVVNVYAHFGLDLDMSFLTEGLKASGEVAYQTNAVGHMYTTQNYERWVRSSDTDTLTFIPKGTDTNSTLAYTKASSYYYNLTYKPLVSYVRDFGLSHVTGLAYMFYQSLSTVDTGSPELLPYHRLSSGIEGTYEYNQKYLLKLDVGYSGSDQYARGSRYTTTPAVSGAWVLSQESFMKDVDWINNLKLRASYGKTANDQCGLGRFSYQDNDTWTTGGAISSLMYITNENQVGNPNIKAEISKKQNYGIDLGLFNGLSLSIDVFRERMDNMVINASANIPTSQGVLLGNYPDTNTGSFKNKGYDFTVNYTKAINKDLTAFVGGFVSFAKNTVINDGSTLKSSDYAYQNWTKGYSYGQKFGYLVDYSNGNGYFNSTDEITNSKLSYSFGTPRVGDLKYKDLNKDGIIDEKDEAPLGTGSLPRYYYGVSGGFNYKSFDLSFLFQGVGEYKTIESGIGIYDTSYDGVYGSLHQNAYTSERYSSGSKITAPALSLTTSTSDHGSDYYLYNRAYLRLKNLQISYTLPQTVSRAISASCVKFILSAQNLFTWDKMKSNDYGPEGNYDSVPVYRVYNIGLSLQF